MIAKGDSMARKLFNEKLQDSKDMPKIVVIDNEKVIERNGGKNMLIASPLEYNSIMGKIPEKKLITTKEIREYLAKKYGADFTCPMTAGIFINLAAQASWERNSDKIPFWRTLKSGGELNSKYPGEIEFQKEMLEMEGHEIYTRGRKNIRYFVRDFENHLYDLEYIIY